MAEHEMTAELVAEPQRGFEIDRRPFAPFAERRARQRFGGHLNGEQAGLDGDDGQAHAGTGDRGAERDRLGVKRRRYREFAAVIAAHAPHPADIRDNPAKHAPEARPPPPNTPAPFA
jgi:hypothetical protein